MCNRNLRSKYLRQTLFIIKFKKERKSYIILDEEFFFLFFWLKILLKNSWQRHLSLVLDPGQVNWIYSGPRKRKLMYEVGLQYSKRMLQLLLNAWKWVRWVDYELNASSTRTSAFGSGTWKSIEWLWWNFRCRNKFRLYVGDLNFFGTTYESFSMCNEWAVGIG